MSDEVDVDRLWRLFASSSPDPLAIKDREGRFVAANPAFLDLLGLEAEAVLGRSRSELSPDAFAKMEAQDAEVRADGQVRTYLDRTESQGHTVDLLVTKGLLSGDTGHLFVIARNLDDMTELGSAVHDRETVFRNLFERVGDGVIVLDLETLGFTEFNAVAHEMLGYTREEFATFTVADIQAEERPEWVQEMFAEIMRTGSARFENRHRHRDGTVRDVIVDNSLVAVAGRQFLVTVIHDITELRTGNRMLSEAQSLAKLGSWEMQLADQVLVWSDETYRIFEVDPGAFQLTFANFLAHVHPDDRDGLTQAYEKSVADHAPYAVEHRITLPDGRIKWVQERGVTEYDQDGVAIRSVGTCQDVTERHQARQELERIAFQDQLTGLPNREAMHVKLDEMLRVGRVALIQVDLEHFQQINGIYGHGFGDAVLSATADLIQTVTKPGDHLSRVGGDEFMVLLPDADEATALAFGERLCELVETHVTGPFGVPVRLAARVGVTTGTGPDGATLLKQADTALHMARETGGCRVFSADMADEVRHRLLVLSRFGSALDNDELFLEYQPQCRSDGELVGIEALVRWRNIQGEVIPPGDFIPVIEGTSLMERVGTWVLDEAMRQVAAWREAGLVVPPVAVNVSARQFQGPQPLNEVVRSTLARHGLGSESLELEITESVMMPTTGEIPEDVAGLASLGVPLAVDDFGTGYSSMSVLYRLPVHKLKIDRSLIRGLPQNPGAAAVVEAAVAMAQAMGLECLAEGVETESELEWLEAAGCRTFQGFWFARPQPADTFAARWLRPVDDRSD